MIYEGDPTYDDCWIKQVVFNDQLKQIAVIEDPGGEYIPPEIYVSDPKFKEKITDQNAAEFAPFLEVGIIYEPSGSFAFPVSLRLDGYIEKSMLRRIGECINEVVDDFARLAGPIWRRRLFYPRKLDAAELELKRKAIREREEVILTLQNKYETLHKKIRGMVRSGKTSAEIAKEFNLPPEQVAGKMEAKVEERRRVKPAEVAKLALMKQWSDEGLDKKLTLHPETLTELLHRKKLRSPKYLGAKRLFVWKIQGPPSAK